jgi:hypothetical protein
LFICTTNMEGGRKYYKGDKCVDWWVYGRMLDEMVFQKELKEFKYIPCLVNLGIWITRSSQIFEEFYPSFQVYAQVRFMMSSCRMIINQGGPR